MQQPTLQFDPHTAWQPYRPTADNPWDAAKVARLHRRAGFGLTQAQLVRDLAEGHEASLDRVLNGDAYGPDGRPAADYDSLVEVMTTSCAHRPSIGRLAHLWLYRLLFSPFPLAEKMTLVWHSHYATNNDKVRNAAWMMRQHQTQRKLWRAPVSQLHLTMLRDPAMLRWLDGVDNRRGRPNENLAREFLELFALGEGNYTEGDIRETARALTGWHRNVDGNGEIEFVDSMFDDGEKTIFGQKGLWRDEDVVQITCRRPAAARHIAWRLWRTFISDTHDPAPELLESLAQQIRSDDVDVAGGIETVLRSQLFFSDACRGRRIASPVEYVISALRACEVFPPAVDLADVGIYLARMGQRLFYLPSVAGWPGGMAWLRGPTLLARANFAAWLTGDSSDIGPPHLLQLASRHDASTLEAWIDLLAPMLTGAALSEAQRTALLDIAAGKEDNAAACAAIAGDLLSLPQAQVL